MSTTIVPQGIAPKGVHLRKVNAEYSLWIVGVFGIDFTGAQISQFIEQVNREGSEPVLKIDSPGGYVTDAMNVYDYVRVNGLKFWAEGYGQVSSAATLLLMAAGRKRSSLAPNAKVLVHEPFGGSDSANAQAHDDVVRIYSEVTGLSKKEVEDLMAEGSQNGRILSAREAKQYGFVGEVLEHQRAAACAMPAEINPTAMADKKTIMVPAKVKLSTLEAARAVLSEEGATVEVEVPVEEATQQVIADKDARIAQLEGELEAAKQEGQAAAEAQSAIDAAKAEADATKAEKEQAVQANAKALEDLKAAHAAEIAELKKPLAKRTEANNADVVPGGGTQTKENPNVVALKNVLKNATVVTPKKA